MKKLIFVAVIAVFSCLTGWAQKNGSTRLSAGPEIGFASGTFGLNWGLAIGVSGQVEHFFQDKLSGTAFIGINDYFGKKISSGARLTSTTIIPIRIGARYYLSEGFHAGLQLGVGFINYAGLGSTAFAYSPQIGYNFKTNKNKAIDLTFKYDGYSTTQTYGALNLRAAYIF